MAFPINEKQQMLALKGVGGTVIARLEQLGFSSLFQLANETPENITQQVAFMLRSSCWKNSPQAQQAITAIIELAQQQNVE